MVAIFRDIIQFALTKPEPQTAEPAPLAIPRVSFPIVPKRGDLAWRELTASDMRMMVVKLSQLVGAPIDKLHVMERYRRVWLISFVPHGRIDPIMPITAVPLGKTHDDAYAHVAARLQGWSNDTGFDQHTYYHYAMKAANKCAHAAIDRLQPGEAQYYCEQLFYSVAKPDRRE